MHQPPIFAHEEGVRVRDGEIVHHLRPHDQPPRGDHTVAAIHAAEAVAHRQLARRHPAAIRRVKGMLRRGVGRLAAAGQRDDGRVEVRGAAGALLSTWGMTGLALTILQGAIQGVSH